MKFKSIFAAVAAVVASGAADAASYERPYVRGITYGGVDSRREIQYVPPFEGGFFYLGARFAFNLINFSNDYHFASDPNVQESDSYSLEKQLGVDASVGYQFAQKWRAELNYGYTGKFEDKDSAANFWLSTQYLMANAIYTINRWDTTSVYAGLGAGAAFLQSHISGPVFLADSKETQTKTTFAGQLIFGLEEDLAPNFAIGVQYRLMFNGGAEHRRNDTTPDILITEIGSVLTNSIMLGARVKF
jgi:opacity protein-like surface antigen